MTQIRQFKTLSFIASIALSMYLLTASGTASTIDISRADPNTSTATLVVDFEDVSSGRLPGTNYDTTLDFDGLDFAESLIGMSRSTVDGFDALDGTPNDPLRLRRGAAERNLSVFFRLGRGEFLDTNVLAGIGPRGYPLDGAIGEGSIAMLFENDQFEVKLDILDANGGEMTVDFYRRDGSLIHAEVLADIADGTYMWRHRDNERRIAGVVFTNDDFEGISIDNIYYHPVPEPTYPLILFAVLPLLNRRRQQAQHHKRQSLVDASISQNT